jgi:microcystin-dependent protein
MAMTVTNQTSSDIYFGPLHLAAGVGSTLMVDDTSATSLYLTSDEVADALNNAAQTGQVLVAGAADPFPRPTGEPKLLHGTGNPEGIVFAPQGSVYMRRDGKSGTFNNGGVVYTKTTGVTFATGWVDAATASGANLVAPPGCVMAYSAGNAPAGWLLCDGSNVSRTTYSVLFAAIGTNYGAGDGSTTFGLPDLRGRVPVGYAASGGHVDVSTLGNHDSSSALAYRRPKHQHTPHIHSPGRGNHSLTPGSTPYSMDPGGSTHDSFTTTADGGSGVATDPVDAPAYLVMNFIIKT